MYGLVQKQIQTRPKSLKTLSKICMILNGLVFKYSTRVKSLTTFSGLDWEAKSHMITRQTLWTTHDSLDAQTRKDILLSVKNAVIFVRYVPRIDTYIFGRELALIVALKGYLEGRGKMGNMF